MSALTSPPPTRAFGFELVLAGPGEAMTEDAADALLKAGCDDGLCGVACGAASVAFRREAPTLEHALATAVRDVGKAGFAVARVVIHAEDLPAPAADDVEPAPAAAGPPAADPAPVAAA